MMGARTQDKQGKQIVCADHLCLTHLIGTHSIAINRKEKKKEGSWYIC